MAVVISLRPEPELTPMSSFPKSKPKSRPRRFAIATALGLNRLICRIVFIHNEGNVEPILFALSRSSLDKVMCRV